MYTVLFGFWCYVIAVCCDFLFTCCLFGLFVISGFAVGWFWLSFVDGFVVWCGLLRYFVVARCGF